MTADRPAPRRRFLLVLESLPSSVPPLVRLRQLLKHALRVRRFRDVDHRELPVAPATGGEESP